MDIILSVSAMLMALCVVLSTIVLIRISDLLERINRGIGEVSITFYRVSQHLAHISDHTSTIGDASEYLLDDPAKLAILLLKDSFLSRKDRDEGIMLVEAVEKQLKKKSRKVEHPVS